MLRIPEASMGKSTIYYFHRKLKIVHCATKPQYMEEIFLFVKSAYSNNLSADHWSHLSFRSFSKKQSGPISLECQSDRESSWSFTKECLSFLLFLAPPSFEISSVNPTVSRRGGEKPHRAIGIKIKRRVKSTRKIE